MIWQAQGDGVKHLSTRGAFLRTSSHSQPCLSNEINRNE